MGPPWTKLMWNGVFIAHFHINKDSNTRGNHLLDSNHHLFIMDFYFFILHFNYSETFNGIIIHFNYCW